jgi:hypothetical protein
VRGRGGFLGIEGDDGDDHGLLLKWVSFGREISGTVWRMMS